MRCVGRKPRFSRVENAEALKIESRRQQDFAIGNFFIHPSDKSKCSIFRPGLNIWDTFADLEEIGARGRGGHILDHLRMFIPIAELHVLIAV